MPPSPLEASSEVAQRDAGGAEVLDALDEVLLEELEAALDEHLLGERVADLHGGALGRAALGERVGGEDGCAADAVAAGAGAEQHDLVADAARVGEVQVLVAQHADGEGVDERVGLVHRVEPGLAADVRQAEAVAVEARCRETTPCTTRAVSGSSMAPKRSASMTATGRAPIEMMSRTMPPTPVAAPWNGSM